MPNEFENGYERAPTEGSYLVELGKASLKRFLFTQDEKTVTKLMSEIQETQETLNKHKADSNVRQQNPYTYIFLYTYTHWLNVIVVDFS